MSGWLFQFYVFCMGWYEFKYDFNLVISTNNDKMRFFTAVAWHGITLGHQMSGGYIWPNVSMTRNLTKCQPDPEPDLWVEGYMWCLLFLYTFETLEADISLHIVIFLHIVLSGNAWHRLLVKWHGMADEPHPQGRYFIEMLQNIFFKYITFSIPKIVFNIVNVSGIEIHLKFTYAYHFYLNVKLLDGYISLHIDNFCYIFFVWKFLRRMLYLLNTYHESFVYFSGVQECITCVVHRNQILSDVKY